MNFVFFCSRPLLPTHTQALDTRSSPFCETEPPAVPPSAQLPEAEEGQPEDLRSGDVGQTCSRLCLWSCLGWRRV